MTSLQVSSFKCFVFPTLDAAIDLLGRAAFPLDMLLARRPHHLDFVVLTNVEPALVLLWPPLVGVNRRKRQTQRTLQVDLHELTHLADHRSARPLVAKVRGTSQARERARAWRGARAKPPCVAHVAGWGGFCFWQRGSWWGGAVTVRVGPGRSQLKQIQQFHDFRFSCTLSLTHTQLAADFGESKTNNSKDDRGLLTPENLIDFYHLLPPRGRLEIPRRCHRQRQRCWWLRREDAVRRRTRPGRGGRRRHVAEVYGAAVCSV